MIDVSQRMQAVQAPMIPIVGAWIAANPGTTSLGQGMVHYGPPPSVAQAVAAAMDLPSIHRYGMVSGLTDLVETITEKLSTENGITIGMQQRVIVSAGSNMGFMNAVLAIADPGDEIIIMSPYYFNHEMAITIANCMPVVVPCTEDYQLDLDAIRWAITGRTKAIVTISPNNPTGAVYPKEDLEAVNRLCAENNIFHISDEAYEYFVYGNRRHFSAASLPDSEAHTVSLFSLSKSYGMAGWRAAYMVIPELLEGAIKKVQDTNLICAPIISQTAAIAALQEGRPWVLKKIAALSEVRELVLEALGRLGDKVMAPTPYGAFYVLAKLAEQRDDMALVKTLIETYQVAVMPGSTFGVEDGTYLRIAYGALDKDSVVEGMGRLVQGLADIL